MKPVELFDCFVAIGRVEAGITLSKKTSASDDAVEKALKSVINLLPPLMETWIKQLEEKLATTSFTNWPPEDINAWNALVKKIEYISTTGEKKIEALWRVAMAYGFILWVSLHKDLGNLLKTQLITLELNSKLIDEIITKAQSKDTEIRLQSLEVIRDLFRQENTPTSENGSSEPLQNKEDILVLEPNFCGIGINLNALVRRWFQNQK